MCLRRALPASPLFANPDAAVSTPASAGLKNCRIGDAGIKVLAAACGSIGALAKLEKLQLHENRITDAGITDLAAAIGDCGALPRLKSLALHDNRFGDNGVCALIDVAAAPGQPRNFGYLTSLSFRSRTEIAKRPLSVATLRKLMDALGDGVFPSLRDIHVYVEATELKEICAARQIYYHLPDKFWDENAELKRLRNSANPLDRERASHFGAIGGIGMAIGAHSAF